MHLPGYMRVDGYQSYVTNISMKLIRSYLG